MTRFRARWSPVLRLRRGATAALALVAVVAISTAATVPAAAAPSAAKPALCAASAVEITATTNRSSYAPGQLVMLKSSITNVSQTPCSVWLGLDPGFSPIFVVANAKGKEVWDRCWVDDQPGACFEILYQHRLNPGRSYHTVAQWDQGSGTASRPPRRVRPGTYTYFTYFGYIAGAQVTFTISPASSAALRREDRT